MMLSKCAPDTEGYLCDPDTGERIVFYECDPRKNILCTKTMCRASVATENEAEIGFCASTLEPLFCKDDGRAFYKKLNEEGYFGREYIDRGETGNDES